MVGRAFSVKIELDLHAVSCPGVWLCPNGKVSLIINIFDSCTSTHKLKSTFPLLYHNKFTFKKVFTDVTTLIELDKKLSEEYVLIELVQWSPKSNNNICLASFETNLVDLLYPVPSFKGLLAGVDIDLLMEPTKFFPGILSPKIEVSTKTTIEEVININATTIQSHIVNPKTINSLNQKCVHKKKISSPTRKIFRQKKVCHTGQEKVNSYVCRICRRQKNSIKDACNCNPCSECECFLHSTDKCYLSTIHKQENCNCTITPKSCENYSICNDAHIFDSCPICLKYKCYFSKQKFNSKLYNSINNYNPSNKYTENRRIVSSRFNCNTTHENCINKVSKSPRTLNSLNLENDTKNSNYKLNNENIHRKCCTLDRHENSSICRSNSVPSLKNDRISSILLEKMKQLETTKEKLNYAKCPCRSTDYMPSNNNYQNNEVQKGFYKNLKNFYKKMYKQAKMRADDLNET